MGTLPSATPNRFFGPLTTLRAKPVGDGSERGDDRRSHVPSAGAVWLRRSSDPFSQRPTAQPYGTSNQGGVGKFSNSCQHTHWQQPR